MFLKGISAVIVLVFPNQLFEKHPALEHGAKRVILVEDSLFFGDPHHPASFHQQKLWLHRATMKRFAVRLQERGYVTDYLDYSPDGPLLSEQLMRAIPEKSRSGQTLAVVDPVDDLVERRLRRVCDSLGMELRLFENPGFINQREDNERYRSGKKQWYMADFYKWQRQRLDVLVHDGEPAGDRWSFDEDNRKKVPKKLLAEIPEPLELERDDIDQQAADYVGKRFGDNPGRIDQLFYPTSHHDARRWLKHFFKHRLNRFGDYEDAIVEGESWLWHSVLTPMLNIGLLTPREVLRETLSYAESEDVPLNSLEGFIRQIIGWREFMRATYEELGVRMRTTNHWHHHRPMPAAFYEAKTGMPPIDDAIERLFATGYCHHIERLMVLGGFLFLCEIDPDDIYRWFMELFVDSYDWVMVPNVYAMSQNADGGLITTKPYFSGSSYIRKMSHYPKGDWCDVWDGLYWRWIWIHHDKLAKNPRWAMMCSMARKMDPAKRERHVQHAETYLRNLT